MRRLYRSSSCMCPCRLRCVLSFPLRRHHLRSRHRMCNRSPASALARTSRRRTRPLQGRTGHVGARGARLSAGSAASAPEAQPQRRKRVRSWWRRRWRCWCWRGRRLVRWHVVVELGHWKKADRANVRASRGYGPLALAHVGLRRQATKSLSDLRAVRAQGALSATNSGGAHTDLRSGPAHMSCVPTWGVMARPPVGVSLPSDRSCLNARQDAVPCGCVGWGVPQKTPVFGQRLRGLFRPADIVAADAGTGPR